MTIYTRREFMHIYRLRADAFTRQVAEGKLRVATVGRRIYVDKVDADAWFEASKTSH